MFSYYQIYSYLSTGRLKGVELLFEKDMIYLNKNIIAKIIRKVIFKIKNPYNHLSNIFSNIQSFLYLFFIFILFFNIHIHT